MISVSKKLLFSVLLLFMLSAASCGESGGASEATFVVPTAAPGSESRSSALTIAVAQTEPSPELDAAVAAFLAENTRYHVDIINYYDAAGSDMDAALELLIADIGDGRAPDMIYLPSFLTNTLSRGGYLDSLYSYIDQDLELRRNFFPQNLLKACEINGSLFTFGSSFYVITAENPQAILGSKGALTFEKLRAAMGEVSGNISMLPPGMTRERFMWYSFAVSGNMYLNRNSMVGNFDCDEYMELLKFAASIPEGGSAFGESLLYVKEIKSFSSAAQTGVYTGIPVPVGMNSGSAAIFAGAEFGILSASDNKAASWTLLRRLLQEQFQLQAAGVRFLNGAPYLPTNISALERMADETLSENGSFRTEGQTASREGAEMLAGLIMEISNVYRDTRDLSDSSNYSPIETIILKHAGLYFQGEKTAADAADDTGDEIRKYLVSGKLEDEKEAG